MRNKAAERGGVHVEHESRRLCAAERKRSATAPLIALHAAGEPQWTPRNYAALAPEGFAANAGGLSLRADDRGGGGIDSLAAL